MSGIVLERLHDALMAVVVGRMAGEAAHVVDLALAAELLEQPLGADLAVADLVVREVVRLRVGHVGVDRDGLDAGRLRLVEGRVERVRAARVEDDRVDVLRDQVTDLLKLPVASSFWWSQVPDVTCPDASASALAVQSCSSRKPLPMPKLFE